MTTPVKENARSAWVPDGLNIPAAGKGSPEKKTGPTKASTRLARPRPSGQNGAAATEGLAPANRGARDASKWRPAGKEPKHAQSTASDEDPLLDRLRRYEKQVEDQQDEIDRLKRHLAELEASRAELSSSSTGARKRKSALDLNEASFEDLRHAGLSVTLSARLIAYRDVGEPIDSVDDLKGLPGFGKETIRTLRAQVGSL
jgi:DNA uptake protein ComE-like DNA-binding protein